MKTRFCAAHARQSMKLFYCVFSDTCGSAPVGKMVLAHWRIGIIVKTTIYVIMRCAPRPPYPPVVLAHPAGALRQYQNTLLAHYWRTTGALAQLSPIQT